VTTLRLYTGSDIIAHITTVRAEPNPGGFSLGRVGPVTEGLVAFLGGIAFLVFVAIWIDVAAHDETAVRRASRDATRKAVGEAAGGPDRAAVERLVRERDTLANPFYGGD